MQLSFSTKKTNIQKVHFRRKLCHISPENETHHFGAGCTLHTHANDRQQHATNNGSNRIFIPRNLISELKWESWKVRNVSRLLKAARHMGMQERLCIFHPNFHPKSKEMKSEVTQWIVLVHSLNRASHSDPSYDYLFTRTFPGRYSIWAPHEYQMEIPAKESGDTASHMWIRGVRLKRMRIRFQDFVKLNLRLSLSNAQIKAIRLPQHQR